MPLSTPLKDAESDFLMWLDSGYVARLDESRQHQLRARTEGLPDGSGRPQRATLNRRCPARRARARTKARASSWEPSGP